MSLENYEGTALDTSNYIEVQPEAEPVQTEVVETVAPEETPTTTIEPTIAEVKEPSKIKVDGVGEFTPEEIKEMKQAGLRQADLRV